MPTLATFARRLFRNASEDLDEPIRGRELGFTGAAAQVVIEDEHRIAEFAKAPDTYTLAHRTYGYLLFVRKNGLRIVTRTGDQRGERVIEKAMQDFANETLLIVERLRNDLRELAYDEFASAQHEGETRRRGWLRASVERPDA